MKILVVSQYFWPENFRINDLVVGLTARGHEVTVLTGTPNYPEGMLNPAYAERPETFSEYNDAEIVRVPMWLRGKTGLSLVINYVSFAISASVFGLWLLRGKYFDVIYAFQPSPVTVGIPAIVAKYLKRAPLVFWVLDIWPETLSAIGVVRSKLLLWPLTLLVRFIYRHCDVIYAQSRSFVGKIGENCDDKQKIVYFPNWAEAIFQDQEIEPTPLIPNFDGLSIMFAGNLGEGQDFPAIIAAAAKLAGRPDIRWLIVGDGRMRPWIEEQVASLGLQERVILLGQHPLSSMPNFFVHADVLLVTLKDTPIFAMTVPGKLQSYLAFGKPVLAMVNGESAMVIRDAGAGIVVAAGDSSGLAEGACQMADMSLEDREALGQSARSYYNREFDREKLFDRLEEQLSQLSAANKRLRRT